MRIEQIKSLLQAGVGTVYPSATAVVLKDHTCVFSEAAGLIAPDIPATVETVYDLASLTKPMATCSVAWAALARGEIAFESPVGRTLFPKSPAWSDVSLQHLMGHASGLPAWRDVGGGAKVLEDMQFENPPGSTAVYSDLGYIALGWYLERVLGAPLDLLVDDIAPMFSMMNATFRPHGAAPTERMSGRGVIQDVVHDPNAYALGRPCGHAGLFSTVTDVARWGQAVMGYLHDVNSVVGDIIRRCWRTRASDIPSSWYLGLDSVSPGISSAGQYFGAKARGHLGYTGTSLWIEPDQRVVVALLTNRVHPDDHPNPEIKRFRPHFHDAVATAFFDR